MFKIKNSVWITMIGFVFLGVVYRVFFEEQISKWQYPYLFPVIIGSVIVPVFFIFYFIRLYFRIRSSKTLEVR